jgi:hypothetical protein
MCILLLLAPQGEFLDVMNLIGITRGSRTLLPNRMILLGDNLRTLLFNDMDRRFNVMGLLVGQDKNYIWTSERGSDEINRRIYSIVRGLFGVLIQVGD